MGNFINPKKIKGQKQLNRMKDLMSKMNTLTESKTFSELELIKRGPNGIVYGIIRENHDYFIKITEKKGGTFLAEDFNYVGGLQNKYDERYGTYAEAIKQLNMKFDMLNESFGIKTNNNIFESDGVPTANPSGGIKSGGIGFVMENPGDDHPDQNCWEAHEKDGKDHDEWKNEQKEDPADVEIEEPGGEQLLDEEGEEVEEQKKVIKVDAPAAPAAPPVEDEVSVDEFGGDEFGGDDEFGSEEEIEVDVEGDDEDNPTKKIQKLTGKVTQQMRELEEPDPELDKYVINSVISAIQWEDMSEEDVEDIIAKIEGDEEEGEGEEVDIEVDAEEGGEEVEVGIEDDLAESEEKEGEEKEKEGDEEEDEGDEDVDYEDKKERKKHYKGDVEDIEDQIAKLKKDLKRAKEEEEKNESRTFSKKQLMESFLKKNANLALKKVLKENQAICEECMGGGCSSCGGNTPGEEGWVSLGEDPMEENLTEEEEFDTFDDWRGSSYYNDPESRWDINRGGDDDTNKHYYDLYREKYGPFRIKPWEDSYAGTFGPDDNDLPWINRKNRYLDEDFNVTNQTAELAGDDVHVVPEQEMDVVTAIATGQDYLRATGDLDRDGDDIPNRLDADNNDDGELDHTMDSDDGYVEISLDSLMGNNPAPAEPTTKPGTKPTTRPGKGKPRWKKIPRPNVDPRPKADIKKSSYVRRGMYR